MAKRQRRRRRARRKEHARRAIGRRLALGAGISLGASLVGGAAAAQADTFVVDRGDDGVAVSGCTTAADDCNLRGAVVAANDNPGQDAITFQSSISGVTLTAGELALTDGVDVTGQGAKATTISGGGSSRIFRIDLESGQTVNLRGLTLQDGNAGDEGGGAIDNENADLNVYDSVLTGNEARDGGAIYERGGFDEGRSLDIGYSTIAGNTASDSGGAVYGYYSAGEIRSSTISGNHADGEGGGLYLYQSSYIDDSTIAGNSAGTGGGIAAEGDSVAVIENAIVAGNDAVIGPDAFGDVDAGFSLVEDASDATLTDFPPGSNLTGLDPQLGPLQDNGGPTPTRRPAATSPVIDKGFAVSNAGIDQRGFDRPVDASGIDDADGGDASDMGAVELDPEEAALPLLPPSGLAPGGPEPRKPLPKHRCKKRKKHPSARAAGKRKKQRKCKARKRQKRR